MNSSDKKTLRDFCKQLAQVSIKINDIKDKEEETYENLSDSQMDGPKGEKLQENIDNLDEVLGHLDEMMELLVEY